MQNLRKIGRERRDNTQLHQNSSNSRIKQKKNRQKIQNLRSNPHQLRYEQFETSSQVVQNFFAE